MTGNVSSPHSTAMAKHPLSAAELAVLAAESRWCVCKGAVFAAAAAPSLLLGRSFLGDCSSQ